MVLFIKIRNCRYSLLCVIVLSMTTNGFSQVAYSGLTEGSPVPMQFWSWRIESDKKLELGFFQQGLVVLDFWASWCTPCLKGMAQMDTVQKVFPEALLLLVNDPASGDSPAKMQVVTSRYNLAHTTGNLVLSQWFPHQVIPHYVWIWKGHFLGTTGKVSTELIGYVLQHGHMPPHFMKNDLLTP